MFLFQFQIFSLKKVFLRVKRGCDWRKIPMKNFPRKNLIMNLIWIWSGIENWTTLVVLASQESQQLPVLPNKILFWLNVAQCYTKFWSQFQFQDLAYLTLDSGWFPNWDLVFLTFFMRPIPRLLKPLSVSLLSTKLIVLADSNFRNSNWMSPTAWKQKFQDCKDDSVCRSSNSH